jgi:glutathione S-transferase
MDTRVTDALVVKYSNTKIFVIGGGDGYFGANYFRTNKVVLQHGEVVIFDSSAILRYLEANVAREPRLFSADRNVLRAIEGWEQRTRGGNFGAPVGMCFTQFFSGKPEATKLREAGDLFGERCREIEAALTPAGFLVGDALTAADLCVVPLLCDGIAPDSLLKQGHPLPRFLCEHLRLPDDCPRARRYVEGVMLYDA